jgi:hypothetical protein
MAVAYATVAGKKPKVGVAYGRRMMRVLSCVLLAGASTAQAGCRQGSEGRREAVRVYHNAQPGISSPHQRLNITTYCDV